MQTISAPEAVTREQQDELLARILKSTTFRKSRRLSDFLVFVCKRYQAGDLGSIQEQRIGVAVFERTEGYHVGEDSIVRSQARFLRQRLEEYFNTEGAEEAIVLTIPKGSYVPSFQPREIPAHVPVPSPTFPIAESPAQSSYEPVVNRSAAPSSRRWLWLTVLGILVLAAISVRLFFVHEYASSEARMDRFWKFLVPNRRDFLIVPSDSSLIFMEQMSGKNVRLNDYINRTYMERPAPAGMEPLWDLAANSQYTNVADLNLISRLERVPQMQGENVHIRYARDLNLKELKNSGALLIGGEHANPWAELFENAGGFSMNYDWANHRNTVDNRRAAPGEKPQYADEVSDGHHVAYGAISFLPSLNGQGSVLLIRGTKKAGTEAAGDFLFTNDFAALLAKVETPQGFRHFEILLSTGEINGDAHSSQVLAFHPLD